MSNSIDEILSEYKLSIADLSELTEIPLETLKTWEKGLTNPKQWIITLLTGYLKQYSRSNQGIITKTKGIYSLDQVKAILLPFTFRYAIDKIVVYGDYSKNVANEDSAIKIIIEGKIEQSKWNTLNAEIARGFEKTICVLHETKIQKKSETYKFATNGVALYNRRLSHNLIQEMING